MNEGKKEGCKERREGKREVKKTNAGIKNRSNIS